MIVCNWPVRTISSSPSDTLAHPPDEKDDDDDGDDDDNDDGDDDDDDIDI